MLDKFKVGQRVRVIKKVSSWSYYGIQCSWDEGMDMTIGKVYTVIAAIAGKDGIECNSEYRLNTSETDVNSDWDYFYPEESLEAGIEIGQQLLFSFMELT